MALVGCSKCYLAVERLRDRLVEAALLTGDYGPIGQRNADRRHLRAAARWLDESGSESKEGRPFFWGFWACGFSLGGFQEGVNAIAEQPLVPHPGGVQLLAHPT